MKAKWIATPNIAVIKYWGKKNKKFNIPYNNSVSVTMDDSLKTTTAVEFNRTLSEDILILNGQVASEKETKRASAVLDELRKISKKKIFAKIDSSNNFPTGAGIASSASGFAALACAAADALGLKLSKKELSAIARLGSGSACRSVYGGFVEWKAGTNKKNSYAVQIAPSSWWKELRNIIVITDEKRKKIGSSDAMDITTATSSLYPKRLETLPSRIKQIKKAILSKNLELFLKITMIESSNLHAVMLDSFPPIIYLNEISFEVIYSILDYNKAKGKICAGYTFDAGPNAHIYTHEKYVKELKEILAKIDGVKDILVCKVGEGPKKIE